MRYFALLRKVVLYGALGSTWVSVAVVVHAMAGGRDEFDAIGFARLMTFAVMTFLLFRLERAVLRHDEATTLETISAEMLLLVSLVSAAINAPSLLFSSLLVVLASLLVTLIIRNQIVTVSNIVLLAVAALVWSEFGSQAERVVIGLCSAVVVPIGWILDRMNGEYAKLDDELQHAKWAASKLSDLTIHLDRTIQAERTNSTITERKRIARQLHDTVGHALTSLIAQADGFKNYIMPIEARSHAERLEKHLCDTLHDLRVEVDALKRDGPREPTRDDWINGIFQLCDVFSECTRVQIDLQLLHLERLEIAACAHVYHIIQEGLTNAFRHGHATRVMVSSGFDRERSMFMLKISDDGRGSPTVAPGHGLQGISARVEELHGELDWRTGVQNGFDLGIEIPVREAS
jgi:signal transduction histidine kinase